MTAEDLLRMPRDGFRYELIRGHLRKMAPAGHIHGRVALNISTPLDVYVRTNSLGAVFAAETGFKLETNPDMVRAPDISFISRERLELEDVPKGYWAGAPDLAVEVLSPNEVHSEVEEKVSDWIRGGARMVVIVNPRLRSVIVYRSQSDISTLTERDVLDGQDVIPGWHLPVQQILEF